MNMDYLQGLCDGLLMALKAVEKCPVHDLELVMLEVDLRTALEEAQKKASNQTILHFLEHDK